MNIRTITSAVACAFALLLAQAAHAAEDFKGHWTMASSTEAGKIHFGLSHRHEGGHSQHESDWPTSAFQGLDVAARGKHDVQFSIVRDAGRFDCEGYLEDGAGAGAFRFTPDEKFAKDLRALGFEGIDADKQFAMAIHDVTVEFARQMKAERLTGFDADKLIGFRIFNVDSRFIREMRAAGLAANDSDKLIAFRVHGVTPAMVREVRKNGIDVDETQLIAFRVHQVTPAFIEKLEGLGYRRPEPNQLVAMRVHGVTPEFISDLQSRGLRNLSIDQLVSMKIHGIN